MKIISSILPVILAFTFFSCDFSEKREEAIAVYNAPDEASIVNFNGPPKLLENLCFTCHNPNAPSHDEILAPPLAGIKQRYLMRYPSREEFVEKMSAFVLNPEKEKALMHGPVKKFGLMPKQGLQEQDIKEIVKYIYENDLPEPKWFQEHYEEMHGI